MLAYQSFYIKVYPDERDNPRRYAPLLRQMVSLLRHFILVFCAYTFIL